MRVRLAALGALVALAFFAAVAPASARSYSSGKTVWFSDVTLGPDDVVHGNLDVVFGNVTCADGAEIDGDVRTFFGNFDQSDGCDVAGRVVRAFDDEAIPWLGPLSNDDVLAQYNGFGKKLAWDIVVVLAFLLFPVRVRVALDRVEKHPGLSGAAGVIVAIAAIPVAIFLGLSIIGIPLIPIEIAALLACIWIGYASVSLLIGRRLYEMLLPHATPSPLGALGLGLLVITAAETFPVVGWAVVALALLVGLGAACLGFVRESSFRSFTHGPPNAPGAPGAGPPMNRPA